MVSAVAAVSRWLTMLLLLLFLSYQRQDHCGRNGDDDDDDADDDSRGIRARVVLFLLNNTSILVDIVNGIVEVLVLCSCSSSCGSTDVCCCYYVTSLDTTLRMMAVFSLFYLVFTSSFMCCGVSGHCRNMPRLVVLKTRSQFQACCLVEAFGGLRVRLWVSGI